jgi:hypothetical protein
MHYPLRQYGTFRAGKVGRMQVQCCVCKRVRKEDRWVRANRAEALNPSVSHGYCPRCASKVLEDIRAQSGLLKELRTA